MDNASRKNFLDLADEKTDYHSSTVVILPIPYERTTTYIKGTEAAPAAIIAASCQVETFDNQLCRDLEDVCINTFDPVEPLPGDAGKSLEAIRATAGRIISDGKFVVGLGGEHTVTFPLVQAAAEAHGTLHVLQIDAHLDLRDIWEGNPWNHACVMRRVVDAGHTVVPVGIRNVSAEEHKFITRTRLEPFFAREIVGRKDWQSEVLDRLVDPVYITIDTDGFDLSVISSVGTPEPGGLGWAETLDLLRDVFEQKRVVGCDVVELAPDEHDEASNFTAARLVAKLIAYHEFL